MANRVPDKAPLASLHVIQTPDGGMAFACYEEAGWVVYLPKLRAAATELHRLGYRHVREINATRRLVGDPEPKIAV